MDGDQLACQVGADGKDLVGDRDDAVAGDLAGHGRFGSVPGFFELDRWGRSGALREPFGGGEQPDRLMGSGLVVLGDPGVERGLRVAETGEDCVGEELVAQVRWNRSILPVVVGDRTPVSRWVMPF